MIIGLLESRACMGTHTERFKRGERRRPMADSVWRKLQYCIIAENFGEVFNSNGEFGIDRQIKNSPTHVSMAISITNFIPIITHYQLPYLDISQSY